MCYFTCSAQEIIHSHCFYLISNKSKMVIMRPPAAPPPIKYTSSCREDQRRSTEGKIVSKYCNLSKTQGEGGVHHPNPPPPTPLVPRRGYGFNCTSEGKDTCMSNTTYWENSQTVVFTTATNNTVFKLLVNIEDNNLKAAVT